MVRSGQMVKMEGNEVDVMRGKKEKCGEVERSERCSGERRLPSKGRRVQHAVGLWCIADSFWNFCRLVKMLCYFQDFSFISNVNCFFTHLVYRVFSGIVAILRFRTDCERSHLSL